MPKLNEIIDSLNDDTIASEVRETLRIEADALMKQNSQLYQRAKRAEGFEFDKSTNKWVKKEIKTETKTEGDPEPKAEKPSEFDDGQKVFIHNILGVKLTDADQMKLVRDYISNGKTLDDLVDNKYFKNDLKDLQDDQASKKAVPDGRRSSGGGKGKDSVEYWLAKGELPPENNPELRRQYVNARIERERGGNPFAK